MSYTRLSNAIELKYQYDWYLNDYLSLEPIKSQHQFVLFDLQIKSSLKVVFRP
jgi:hypothetical protein